MMSEKPLPYHIVATPNGVEIHYLVTAEQAAEHFDVHLAEPAKTPAPVEFYRDGTVKIELADYL